MNNDIKVEQALIRGLTDGHIYVELCEQHSPRWTGCARCLESFMKGNIETKKCRGRKYPSHYGTITTKTGWCNLCWPLLMEGRKDNGLRKLRDENSRER